MANVSQAELRARGRVLKPRVTPEAQIQDVEQDAIKAQRQSFEKAKEDISGAVKSTKPTAASLRAGRLSRIEKIKLREVKKDIAKAEADVMAVEKKFEKEVAEKVPERATPEERQSAINKAIQDIKNVITKENKRIQKYREREKKWDRKDRDDLAQKYDDLQDEKKAYVREYEKALNEIKSGVSSKVNLAIKKFYGGFTKKIARHKEDVAEYYNERSAARRKWEKENPPVFFDPKQIKGKPASEWEGFSMKPEYAKELGYVAGTFSYKDKRPVLTEEFTPDRTRSYETPEVEAIKTQLYGDYKKDTILQQIPPIQLTPYKTRTITTDTGKKLTIEYERPTKEDLAVSELLGFQPLGMGRELEQPGTFRRGWQYTKGIAGAGKEVDEDLVIKPISRERDVSGYKKYDDIPFFKAISPAPKFVFTKTGEGLDFLGDSVGAFTTEYLLKPSAKVGWGATKFYSQKMVLPAATAVTSVPQRIKAVAEREDPSIKGMMEAFIKDKSKDLVDFTKTPIGDVAKVKLEVEKLDPETEIQIGMLGNRRTVLAGELQGKGLYDFSKDIILGEVEESFTGLSKVPSQLKVKYVTDPYIKFLKENVKSDRGKEYVKRLEAGRELTLQRGDKYSKWVGKGVSIGTGVAPYFISGAFTTEYGIGALEAATGGKFGGAKDPIQFVGDKPLETAIIVGGGMFKGIKILKTTGKGAKIADKYKPFLKKPVDKTFEMQGEAVTKPFEVGKLAAKKQYTLTTKSGKLKPEILRIGKERLKAAGDMPTGQFKGTFEQGYRVGEGFTKGKVKIFQGTWEFNSKTGKFIQRLDIGKNLQKVVKMNKDGTGVIQIVKKGKVIGTESFKGGVLPAIKYSDSARYKPEPTLTKTGEARILREELISTKGIKKPEIYTVPKKLKGTTFDARQPDVLVETGKTLDDQYAAWKKTSQNIKDNIKASTQKAGAKVKSGFAIRYQQPRQITYAKSAKELKSESDIALKFIKGKKQLTVGLQRPAVDRTIYFGYEQSVGMTDKFLSPKVVKNLKKAQSTIAKQRQIAKTFKIRTQVNILDDLARQKGTLQFNKFAKAAQRARAKKLLEETGRLSLIKSKKGTLYLSNLKTTKTAMDYTDDAARALKKPGKQQLVQALEKPTKRAASLSDDVFSLSDDTYKLLDDIGYRLKDKKPIEDILKKVSKTPKKLKVLSPEKLKSQLGISFIEPVARFGFAPAVKASSKLLPSLAVSSLVAMKELSVTKPKLDAKVMQKEIQKIDTAQAQEPKIKQLAETKQIIKPKPVPPITTTTTRTITDVIPKVQIPTPRIPRPKIRKIPIETPEEMLKTKLPKKKKKLRLKKEPTYYIPEAKRNNKWVKLSATGLTEQAARGRGARAVDMTVAGRFRIRKTSKGTDKIVDNYFAYNKDKFRDYKIKKGKKIPLTNTWIEKRAERISTVGEKQGLTIAKWLKKKGYAGRKKQRVKPKKKLKLKF